MSELIRYCVGCQQSDDGPRHIIDIGGTDVYWHPSCHALVTGCEICAAQTEEG